MSFALPISLDDDQTSMALTGPSRRARYHIARPRMRYDADLRKLNFVAQRFERSLAVCLDKDIASSLTGGAGITTLVRLTEGFTTALPSVAVTWDYRGLHSTFVALSEGYDVAATEEASLSATKRFGW